MRNSKRGLTVVEVIVSLAILAVVLAVFSTNVISSMQQNASSGSRTAAVRFLDHVGRLVVEGNSNILPTGSTPRTWAYGTLGNLSGLTNQNNLANPALYRATVTAAATPGWSTTLGLGLISYQLEVCWRNAGDESCVRADGVGPSNAGAAPASSADIN
jgi:prepilin-type N-terminal cleavage/methylation domain-containing protein